MSKEIIEILEYLKNNPTLQGIEWAAAIGTVLAIVGVVAVFVFIMRQMLKMDKEMDDFRNNRRKK